jgi:hypothetical protein
MTESQHTPQAGDTGAASLGSAPGHAAGPAPGTDGDDCGETGAGSEGDDLGGRTLLGRPAAPQGRRSLFRR